MSTWKEPMEFGEVENTTISELHRQIVKELHEIEDQVYELTQRQKKLSELLDHLEDLYQELPRYAEPNPAVESPRGQEAVRRALEEVNGRWVGVKKITSELQLRRWIDREARDPEAAVRAALRRLIESPDSPVEQKKVGRSVFYRIASSGSHDRSEDSHTVSGALLAPGGKGG